MTLASELGAPPIASRFPQALRHKPNATAPSPIILVVWSRLAREIL